MVTGDRNIVIAGNGIAASIVACELRRHGFEVWLIERSAGETAEGVEALSAAAVTAFTNLGLESVFAYAGAVVGEGFENAWEGLDNIRFIKEPCLNVERGALARALRSEAAARGARTLCESRLPRLTPSNDPTQGFDWAVPGLPRSSMAAIDATGRSARWIGKIARRELKVASLFRGPGTNKMRSGRVVRTPTGWAYALFHPDQTTVGLIDIENPSNVGRRLPNALAEALDLPASEHFHLLRRCPANAQWALVPIKGSLLAIGDAAFACEPVAGQGIRFALASATAAAAVLVNQRDGYRADVARRYYLNLVDSARRRHLAYLDAMADDFLPKQSRLVGPEDSLVFSGEVIATGLRRGDVIVQDYCLRMPDGGLVRWLGRFDLLELRTLAATPRSISMLQEALRELGLGCADVETLLRWSIDRRVLSPIGYPILE
jgi:2-polyprenyl-6-methoxyphenol hydroxylase-like FAD-dependent oxidoreductase